MDVTTKYKSAIVEFETTQSLIGAYCGLKTSRVSRGLTGEIPFDARESALIEETIAAMRQLQAETRPLGIPVNWSLIGRVKPLVDARRTTLREQSDPVVVHCAVIRISRTGYFLKMQAGDVRTTPNELHAAAFENPETAKLVCRELEKIGTRAEIELLGAFRRQSTMSHTLIDVGFESAAIGGTSESAEATT